MIYKDKFTDNFLILIWRYYHTFLEIEQYIKTKFLVVHSLFCDT